MRPSFKQSTRLASRSTSSSGVAAEDKRLQALGCKLAEECFDFTPRIQVHASRRVIEQHHIGGHYPRARQRQPLLLANGQRACAALGERGQADARQRLVRMLAGVAPPRAAQPEAQCDVALCGRAQHEGTLEQQASDA